MSALEYIYDHPELIAVVWPILTALLSLVHGVLARRYPVVVAVLRASGLDLPGVARALRAAVTRPAAPPAVPPTRPVP